MKKYFSNKYFSSKGLKVTIPSALALPTVYHAKVAQYFFFGQRSEANSMKARLARSEHDR